MNVVSFPWPAGEYYFEQPWTLDGITYLCTLRFNLRIQTWFLDLADITGSTLVCGIPLICGRNLLGQYKTRNVPGGVLYVVDPSGNGQTPGQEDFSLGFLLLYVSDT